MVASFVVGVNTPHIIGMSLLGDVSATGSSRVLWYDFGPQNSEEHRNLVVLVKRFTGVGIIVLGSNGIKNCRRTLAQFTPSYPTPLWFPAAALGAVPSQPAIDGQGRTGDPSSRFFAGDEVRLRIEVAIVGRI
jgi:hypothetical protein